MTPLFYVAAVVALAAIAVTVYELLFAPDGFEDDEGFHAVHAESSPETPAASEETNRDSPPFVSAL
jgi:hypothetical protein